jgi:hypothetical protein
LNAALFNQNNNMCIKSSFLSLLKLLWLEHTVVVYEGQAMELMNAIYYVSFGISSWVKM